MIINFIASIFFLVVGLILVYKSDFFMDFEDQILTQLWKREVSKEKDSDQRYKATRGTGRIFIGVGIFALAIAIIQYFTL